MAFPVNTYKLIVENINGAHSVGVSMVSLMENMEINWGRSEIDDNDIEKLLVLNSIIKNKENLSRKHVTISGQLSKFIFKLQQQAIVGYSSIDNFLSSNGIKVGLVFADLSSNAGFPINSSNIED